MTIAGKLRRAAMALEIICQSRPPSVRSLNNMKASDATLRIAVARARAAAFEEKARTYPERAAELTEMARKLKVAAALMERSGEQTPGQTASAKPSS